MHFYCSWHSRAECMVNTWAFWIRLGKWYAKLRVLGLELGVGLGSN